jgi:hypothetical protein
MGPLQNEKMRTLPRESVRFGRDGLSDDAVWKFGLCRGIGASVT